MHEYGLTTLNSHYELSEGQKPIAKYDAIVLTVAHKEFLKLNLTSLLTKNGVIYDVKGVLGNKVDGKL
jgi:UDP-N-acetyl-D-galactosamine dehydrogenase